ncbi:hypothetical protein [Clostridium grantii]|uniref:Uncharacterized protein n=1 Tax=Clostridium grantii DSM 8605 TaxID=1121316 RepID=A0A1M5S7W8_9CLOT|nr:hypothetical protein [Clostridium grantii]SHH34732.1 hypothetical protein SAMN02745207_00807 [Clostridium grantii DSM 8605]
MDKNNKFVLVVLISTILVVYAQLSQNETAFALGMGLVIYSWLFLGAAKNGKVPKVLAIMWGITFLIMTGSLLAMLNIVKVPENIISSHFLGFPLPTAILFFLFWMLVGLVNNATYSVRFNKDIMKKEWVEEFEEKTGTVLLSKKANVLKDNSVKEEA